MEDNALDKDLDGRKVVDMEVEDKLKVEGILEEDRLMAAGKNAVEAGMQLDSVDMMSMPLDSVDMMGTQELWQGMLWWVHRKEELIGEEVESTKAPEEPKKHMGVQMVHCSFPVLLHLRNVISSVLLQHICPF